MSGIRTLAAVRRDIDAIDETIHELITRRTELVEEVRRLKRDWRVKIQPAREAEIIYRLVANHRGPFPKQELIAIWRSLIVATLSFEGPFSVAVCLPEGNDGVWDLARDHFGGYVTMTRDPSPTAVIEAVDGQRATVGVLPAFAADDPSPWWARLFDARPNGPRIIARLPFAGSGNARPAPGGAFVVCPVAMLPSGRDRAFIVVSSASPPDRDHLPRALAAAGMEGHPVAHCRGNGDRSEARLLIEIVGCLTDDDPRPMRLASELAAGTRVGVIGGYAEPLHASELAAATDINDAVSPAAGGVARA